MNNLPDRRDYPERRQQSSPSWPRPQWVIVGIDLPTGGVRIIASDSLTTAELEVQYDWLNLGLPVTVGISRINRYEVSLTLKMLNLRIVEAATYGEALSGLFGNWTPERRIAIER